MPPPPAELQQLQRERNWIILRARDQLRAALGPQAFRQLDDYVKLKIVPNIKPALPGVRPNGPTSTR
ncbi:MAG: hypothetical protein IRZ19_09415 [Pyrinomonas methylaliphatogenes]|nr:hypothetical protein [Pyrinomonas methylaliphatogenes]